MSDLAVVLLAGVAWLIGIKIAYEILIAVISRVSKVIKDA